MKRTYEIDRALYILIEDEAEANKGYADFLVEFENDLSEANIDIIKEIISEEHKHACDLLRMHERITGIKEAEQRVKVIKG